MLIQKLEKKYSKVTASDLYDFKTGKKIPWKEEQSAPVSLDWSKAKIYPVQNLNMKVLSLNMGKHTMISFIPKSGMKIRIQLDEIGGDFSREITTLPVDKLENYIKTQLPKDIEKIYKDLGTFLKVSQKISPDLGQKIAQIQEIEKKVS